MKKIVTLCFLIALVCVKGWGQTITAINPATDGGFELGTTFADNGWATAMAGNNFWYLGGVAKTAGSKGAYIDVNASAGAGNTYNMATSRVNYIYKDVPIPIGATNIILNFKWRAVGENGTGADSWDFLRVFLVSNTTTITGGTLLSSGSIGLGKYNLSSATTFSTAAPITIPNSSAGTTQRLAFCWVNDGSGGTNPPAAVDEISLTYTAPPPTLGATALAAFGAQCINGTYGPNSFTINGASLTAAPVTVAALSGYTYATTSAGPYSSSLSLTQPGGNYSQQIFVQFSPTLVQSYSGPISVGGGGASSISVTASGSGVNTAPTATSGAASSVTYNTATVAGSLTAGCSTISAYGIEYSTTPSFANGSGTPVASSNLSGGAFSSNLTGLTGSTPYYFHAYATPTSGSTVYGAQGTFTTLATPPANDNCATAFTITPGVSCVATSGTNVNATQQYTPATCSGSTSSSALDVWYQFTADGSSSYTISVTGSGNSTTGFDPVLQLFSGCSTSNAISCIDATDRGGTETIAAGVLAAGTYYYRIYGWSGSTGTFTTCVTAPLTYKDLWISMNVGSTSWCAGETRNVTVTVKNNGTATWTTSSPTVNVGVKWNTNGTNWADYYVRVSAANLAPGATNTYILPITASNNTGSGYTTPLAAGTNNLTFDVVEEGVSWFGDNGGNTGPGNVVFKSANLTINALPQGSLTGNTICAGGTGQLTFTATAGTGPFTVVYNDGTTNQTANNVVSGTAFSPATNPTTTTTYTLVSVTNSATGNSCVTSSGFTGGTATITVNTPPTVSNPSDQTTCAGTSKTFSVTATGTSPIYQWQYLNGATWTNLTNTTIGTITYSNTTTATMTAAPSGSSATGTYQYRCQVSVASCSTVFSNAATFTVNATPTAVASSNTPVCVGSTLNLTGTTNIGTSFAWTGPNSFSSTLQNPSIANVTTANAGSYSFTATANGCPSATVNTTVVVNTPPTVSNPSDQTTCAGTSKTFSVTATGTSPTYQWQYLSGATWTNLTNTTIGTITYSNTTTATMTAAPSGSSATGTYQYRCQVSVASCSTVFSNAATFTVNATPTAVASSNTPVCVGSTLNLTGTTNIGTSFAWTGPNSFSSTLQNPSIANVTTANAGSYSFTATANGCPSATVNTTVVVNTPPTVSNPSNAAACTSGSLVTFSVTATGTSPTYQWQYSADGITYNSIANGTAGGFTFSGATTNTLSVTAGSGATPGTYYTRCVVSVSGCSTPATSNPATLTVTAAVSITTQPASQTGCVGSPVTFSVVASNATTYQWRKGTTPISGATSSSYMIASVATGDAGSYNVVVGGASPCGSTTSSSATLTVNAAFTGVTASATPNPICLGSSSQLLATSSTVQSYGYTSISSPVPTTGTPVKIQNNSFSSLDDGFVTVPFPSGFAFRLYGTSYSQLSVSVNGYVMFNSGANTYAGNAIPNTDFANPAISLCYSDLELTATQGEIDTFTVGTAPNRKFIIKYNNVGFYKTGTTVQGTVTGQIELNESDNDFDLYLNNVAGNAISTTKKAVGVQYNSTQGIGVTTPVNRNGVNFTVSATEGYHFSDVTYTWSPATALSATNIANPVATPTTTTQYTVTGTNGSGCTSTSSVTVTVNPNTTIALSSAAGTDAQELCANSPLTPITYQIGGSGNAASIPGGVLPAGVTGSYNSTTKVYTISGTPASTVSGSFPYTITATGPCTTVTISGTITVDALPSMVNFTAAGAQYYCTDADGNNGDGFEMIIDASQVGVNYELQLNGSTIATEPGTGSSINFGFQLTPGTYTVKGTNATTGCNRTVTNQSIILSVRQRPSHFTVTVDGAVAPSVAVCSGNSFVIGLTGTQTGVTYRLTRNGSSIGTPVTGNGGVLSFPAQTTAGTYGVYANSTCGLETMDGQVVATVNPRPTPSFTTAPSGSYCSGQSSVTYTTQSGQSSYVWTVPGVLGTDYTITSGGISATDNTVTLTWLTAGSKTVTVNYNNSFGCNGVSPATSTITINPLPTAAISGTTTVCQNSGPQNITFTGANGTAPYTFTYTVSSVSGNQTITTTSGNSVTVSQPTSTAGTYTYTLVSVQESSSTACSNAASGSATITVTPSTVITGNPSGATYCQNATATALSVSATGTPIITYQWFSNTSSSNSGGTLVGSGSTYTPSTATAGTFYYYAVATSSSCGSVPSSVATIIINPSTVITGNPSGATYCQGQTATALSVAATGTGTLTYQWFSNASNSNSGGTLVSTSGTYTPSTATAGTFYYYVTVTGGCGTATSTVAIITINPSTAITTNPAGGTYCQNGIATALSVGASGTGTLTYQWFSNTTNSNSGGTLVSTSSTYTPSTATAGTLYYYVTVTGSCGSATSSVATITVNPATVITTNPSDATYCQNATATALTVGASGTGTLTYQWFSNTTNSNSGGTLVSTSGTYTPSTATAGTLYYYVTVTGSCGSATSPAATIIVNPTLDAAITSAPSAVCFGSGAGVNVFSNTGGILTYTTTVTPDGTPVEHTATLTANGTITLNDRLEANTTVTLVSVTSATGCNYTLGNSTVTITVNPLPTVAAISGPAIIATGATVAYTDATTGGVWTSTAPGVANVISQNNSISRARVNGVSVGDATITYTVGPDANGCTNAAELPIQVYDNLLTRYRTTGSGNFSTTGWEKTTDNGTTWTPSTAPDGNNTNVEIRDTVILDTNYVGTENASFRITGHGDTIGVLRIAPNRIFSSSGGVDFNERSVIVQSDVTGSGAIGQMTNVINGADSVTVERYIGSLLFPNGRRAWRLLTAPVRDRTIHQTWQEGRTWTGGPLEAITGVGTLITGEGQPGVTDATSFDYIPNSAHHTSIKQYFGTATGGSWNTIQSNAVGAEGTDLPVRSQPAWLLFVRGDRTKTSSGSGITTLRATGTLNQADTTITVDHTMAFTLVGNPYAAPINFDNIYNSSISNTFFIWNSQQGDFGAYNSVIRNGDGSYTIVPFNVTGTPDSSARYIQSGQGFFVSPSSTNTDGSITIDESAKNAVATGGTNTFREVPVHDRKLWVNLNLKDSDTSATVADGVLARFDASYSAGVDVDDAIKQANLNENLGIRNSQNDLMIEARPDIAKTDTVQLKLWNVTKRNYQFQVKADNFTATTTLHAYLEDAYLGTKQEVSLSGGITTINFTVTSDSLSAKSDRFRIVFQNNAVVLPVTLTSIKAAPANGGVTVSWTVSNEVNIKQYTIERSTDGGRTYSSIGTQAAKNNTAAPVSSYSGFDALPKTGDNLYRIRIEGKDGAVSYSSVATVSINAAGGKIEITLYPNPVRNGKVNLQLSNLKEGTYLASVYSEGGQSVYQRKITVGQPNITQSEELKLGNSLAQGSYQLRLTDSKGMVIFKSQLVVGR